MKERLHEAADSGEAVSPFTARTFRRLESDPRKHKHVNRDYLGEHLRISKSQILELVQRLISQVRADIEEIGNVAYNSRRRKPRFDSARRPLSDRGLRLEYQESVRHTSRAKHACDELSWLQQLRKRV
jgi:hypothetical protein